VPGRSLGLSPIEYYASTINAGLDSQSFGTDWFKGGGFPPAVFKNTQKVVGSDAAATIRARLASSMRRKEPLVTGMDWDFTPIMVPPDQAQFIETQKLSANQVAAIYGLDATEIGGEAANSLTYSTEETRQINRAANMRPYLHRFEEAFASWLPLRQYVKFNTDATIKVDTKTRHEVYAIQREIGLRSVNEQRALEDLPPVPGGDVHVPAPVQQQPADGTRHLSVVNPERDAQYE
jgi:HK97 family phage portal protein